MLNRSELKSEARGIIKSAQVSAYVFSLIYLVITGIINAIDAYISDDIVYVMDYLSLETPEIFIHKALPSLVVTFVTVMVFLLNVVLSSGYAIYHLGIRKNQLMSYSSLYDGFSYVGKIVVLSIIQRVIITLLTALLIFPGIIFSYRYRFAIYNLIENPSIGVLDAMRMSAQQTQGFKWALFVLDLSFIGWNLLSILTAGILQIWILPYVEQTDIGYYTTLKNRCEPVSQRPSDSNNFHF